MSSDVDSNVSADREAHPRESAGGPRGGPAHGRRAGGPSWIHVVGLVLLASAGLGAYQLAAGRRSAEAGEARLRKEALERGALVEVAAARAAPPTRSITLNGEVHAYRESTLYAKVSGYLKLVRVDKGDRVADNEVLGVIEAPEVEQQIASKKADLAIKKLTDARYRGLAGSGVVAQQEMEKATADVQIATADLAALTTLRGYQVIRAPFDGVITARYADPGALLQAATSSQSALPLVRIADLDRARIDVYLGQNEALLVHEGDPVTVWAEPRPDQQIEAKITRFSKELDPRTRTMITEIEIDNRETRYYPGTFVKVRLTVAEPKGVVIPADAVAFDAGKSVVAVARDGHAHFVPIEIVDTDGRVARLRPGAIREGDQVILHPSDEVADGSPIQIAQQPSASAPGPSGSSAAGTVDSSHQANRAEARKVLTKPE